MSTKLEQASHFASVVGAVIAAIAVLIAGSQFREAQAIGREARAVDLFVKYNELMIAQPSPAAETVPVGTDPRMWRSNLAVAIAEAVFRFTKGDAGWKLTTRYMVETHKDYLVGPNHPDCKTYDRAFVDFINEVVHHDLCDDPRWHSIVAR